MQSRFVICVAAIAAAGCSRGDRVQVDSAAGRLSEKFDSAAAQFRQPASAPELSGLINAVNDAEIQTGNMVSGKATNAEVKDFARQIVRDHEALKGKVDEFARGQGITPVAPGAGEDLVQDHEKMMSDLTAKARGKDFDKAFVDDEVDMHRKALDKVEDALGRNPSPELRTLLETARGGLQGHLAKAEQLQKKLGS